MYVLSLIIETNINKTSKIRKGGKRLIFPICRTVNGPALKKALIEAGVNNVVLYSDVPHGLPLIGDVMIVQIESFHRVMKAARRLGYVVLMDEIEGLLAEFSSSTMDGKRSACYRAFWDTIMHAEALLCMDALMGGRSIAWIKACCKARSWKPTFIIHEPIIRDEEKRIGIDVGSWEALVNIGLKKLQEEKRVVMVCSSKQKLIQFYETMKEKLGIEIKIYHSASGAERMRDLENVEEVWMLEICIGYSPSITVSLSCRGPFHSLLIWGSTYSCSVRDLIQSMHRVRMFEEKEIYFALCDKIPRQFGELRCTLEAHKGAMRWHERDVQSRVEELGLTDYVSEEELPECVLENELWNRLERYCSRMFFREMLSEYFERCDIRIDGETKKKYEIIELEEIPDVLYDNIRITMNVDVLRSRVLTKLATSVELAMWNKVEFINLLVKECPEEIRRELYDRFWRDKKTRTLIENIRYHLQTLSLDLKEEDLRKLTYHEVTREGRSLSSMRMAQLTMIVLLCASLGIKNCYESCIIKRERMVKLEGVDKQRLRKTFNKRWQGKEKEEHEDFKINLQLVNSIFKQWCGSRVTTTKDKRIMTDSGERIHVEDILLIPVHQDLLKSLKT